ncbi:hypothetical protein V8B97DRAFT_2007252 [Scleroderma yunnanense]
MATHSTRTYPQGSTRSVPAPSTTEPKGIRFMGFMPKKRAAEDEDEGIDCCDSDDAGIAGFLREKKLSQEEQDHLDKHARRRAMSNLVNSWQERLQLISVITTFFASVEAGMLVNTKPLTTTDQQNNTLKASNASLLGALVMHVYAAVLSFLAAFLLIRYKLQEASREELIAEGHKWASSPLHGSFRAKNTESDVESARPRRAFSIAEESPSQSPTQGRQPILPLPKRSTSQFASESTRPGLVRRMSSVPRLEPPILSTNPHLEQVGLLPWSRHVSSHLLSRIHTLCILFASIGFVLAIAGIVLYAWALQPIEVSVFTSACLGGAILAMVTLAV